MMIIIIIIKSQLEKAFKIILPIKTNRANQVV